MNKASGGDGISAELFQILKDDAVKVLHSICQKIWKTQQWPQDWKRAVFILIPKKGIKEIKPVNSKRTQSWIFIGRTDAESKAPILWPPDVKNWFIRKDPDAGKIEGRRRRGRQRMRRLDGITDLMNMSLSKLPEMVKEQGSLACCSPWGCRELDTTEWLNNNKYKIIVLTENWRTEKFSIWGI